MARGRRALRAPVARRRSRKAAAPGAESWIELLDRAEEALYGLAEAHPGELVVVSGHGGIIEASLVRFLGLASHGSLVRLFPDNASMTEWAFTGSRWWLVRFNDATHLDPAGRVSRVGCGSPPRSGFAGRSRAWWLAPEMRARAGGTGRAVQGCRWGATRLGRLGENDRCRDEPGITWEVHTTAPGSSGGDCGITQPFTATEIHNLRSVDGSWREHTNPAGSPGEL